MAKSFINKTNNPETFLQIMYVVLISQMRELSKEIICSVKSTTIDKHWSWDSSPGVFDAQIAEEFVQWALVFIYLQRKDLSCIHSGKMYRIPSTLSDTQWEHSKFH